MMRVVEWSGVEWRGRGGRGYARGLEVVFLMNSCTCESQKMFSLLSVSLAPSLVRLK